MDRRLLTLPPKMFVCVVVWVLAASASVAQAAGPFARAADRPVGPIARITVTGNVHVSPQEIFTHVAEKTGAEYDPAAAAKDQDALKATGLFSDVQIRAASDLEYGVDLSVSVTQNPVVKGVAFTADTPDGLPPIPADDLRAHMEMKIGQPLNTNTLVSDLRILFDHDTGYLRSRGFLADVSSGINIDPNMGVMTVPLVVGRVARIDVLGGRRAAAEVRRGLRTKTDDVFDLNALRQDLSRVQGRGAVAQDGDVSVAIIGPGQVSLTVHVLEKPEAGPNPASVADWLPLPTRWAGAIIPVRVNDTTTAFFALDTTGTLSSVSPGLAARLHLTPRPWVVGGRPVPVNGQPGQVVTLARMRLGSAPGVAATDEAMPIFDTKAISTQLGHQIDGILGVSDLGAQAVSFDWDRRQVRFWQRGSLSAVERTAAGFAGALALPLTTTDATQLQFAIDARLTGNTGARPEMLVLATTSGVNQIPAAEATALGAAPFDGGDNPPSRYVRPGRMASGGLSVNGPAFLLGGDGTPALLGQDFLSHYRVLLDYAARRVYLQPVVRITGAAGGCTVPFTYDPITTPLPVIQASLDGGPPMRFVFDTGFNNVLTLDRSAARRLGLPLDNNRHEITNDVLPAPSAPVRRLVLRGRTRADDLGVDLARASMTDIGLIQGATVGPPIAGVIGAGILRDTAVRFNYATQTLTFFPRPLPDAVPAEATALPLTELTQDDAYFVTLTPAPGQEVRLLIDSGSSGTNAPFQAVSFLHPNAARVNGAWLLTSFALAEDVHLPRFDFGSMNVPDVVVGGYPTETSGAAWAPGTLGENILSRYRVTLDPPHRRLLLEPPAGPAFHSGWPGLFLQAVGGGIRIRRVQPGTPAAQAGLQAGDQVLQIDGHPLQGVGVFLAQSLADGAAGTVGVFQIRRGTAAPRTVRLDRSADVDPPALDGLIGRRDLTHPLVIKAVLPGSPAENAGMHPGDVVTTINGMVTATMTDADWEDVLLEPRLTLTVRPADALTPRTVRLQGHAPPTPKASGPPKE